MQEARCLQRICTGLGALEAVLCIAASTQRWNVEWTATGAEGAAYMYIHVTSCRLGTESARLTCSRRRLWRTLAAEEVANAGQCCQRRAKPSFAARLQSQSWVWILAGIVLSSLSVHNMAISTAPRYARYDRASCASASGFTQQRHHLAVPGPDCNVHSHLAIYGARAAAAPSLPPHTEGYCCISL